MRFWDTSALVYLCVEQTFSESVRELLSDDNELVCSWLTVLECWSAFARLRREGGLTSEDEEHARSVAKDLCQAGAEVSLTGALRDAAGRLLRVHDLRAAHALQLASGLAWVGGRAAREGFVCFDIRLRRAASLEGFRVLPVELDAT